jgi:hypothetical protein
MTFQCSNCVDKELKREGGLYICPECNRNFDQFELCFGAKAPPGVKRVRKPRIADDFLPPYPGPEDDRFQPSKIPKKPRTPDGATSIKLELPVDKKPESS